MTHSVPLWVIALSEQKSNPSIKQKPKRRGKNRRSFLRFYGRKVLVYFTCDVSLGSRKVGSVFGFAQEIVSCSLGKLFCVLRRNIQFLACSHIDKHGIIL
jgi:hypothetical protein